MPTDTSPMSKELPTTGAGSAQLIVQWLKLAESILGNSSDRLNAINIFPVPDGDTGSNMYHTVSAATRALEAATDDTSITQALRLAGTAALDNAQGNSGTLIAVFLNSLAEPTEETAETPSRMTAPVFARGLERARTAAWAALSNPQEGTLLTVLDTAAKVATHFVAELAGSEPDHINSKKTLGNMANTIVEAAWAAVEQTENQLAELTEAQVVDAGGLGLLLVLDAWRATIQGNSLDPEILDSLHGFQARHPHMHEEMSVEEGYEVMCSMQLTPLDAATVRIGLNEVGDSVIMTPISNEQDEAGTIRWRIHVHVPQPEDALAIINAAGTAENQSITALHAGNPTPGCEELPQ